MTLDKRVISLTNILIFSYFLQILQCSIKIYYWKFFILSKQCHDTFLFWGVIIFFVIKTFEKYIDNNTQLNNSY